MFIYKENNPIREAEFFVFRGRIRSWQFQLYQRLYRGKKIGLPEENVAQVSSKHNKYQVSLI